MTDLEAKSYVRILRALWRKSKICIHCLSIHANVPHSQDYKMHAGSPTMSLQLFLLNLAKTKYLPLGNYIFHLSTLKKVLCFQLSHLHKVFTCFRHKASIFPSSCSSLWCLFQPHVIKIEGRANLVEWFSEEKCLAGLSGKWSTFCAFLQAYFALLLCCCCSEPTHWCRWKICIC